MSKANSETSKAGSLQAQAAKACACWDREDGHCRQAPTCHLHEELAKTESLGGKRELADALDYDSAACTNERARSPQHRVPKLLQAPISSLAKHNLTGKFDSSAPRAQLYGNEYGTPAHKLRTGCPSNTT